MWTLHIYNIWPGGHRLNSLKFTLYDYVFLGILEIVLMSFSRRSFWKILLVWVFLCWNLTSLSWNPSNDSRVTVWTLYILHYTLKLWWNIRFLERGFLNKSRHPNFTILWLFPTLDKVWQSLTTLSSLGMHYTKFYLIWPSGSIED